MYFLFLEISYSTTSFRWSFRSWLASWINMFQWNCLKPATVDPVDPVDSLLQVMIFPWLVTWQRGAAWCRSCIKECRSWINGCSSYTRDSNRRKAMDRLHHWLGDASPGGTEAKASTTWIYSLAILQLSKQVEAGAEELGLDIEKYLDATGFWETPMSQKALEFVVCHSIIFCPYFGADCFIPMQQ